MPFGPDDTPQQDEKAPLGGWRFGRMKKGKHLCASLANAKIIQKWGCCKRAGKKYDTLRWPYFLSQKLFKNVDSGRFTRSRT